MPIEFNNGNSFGSKKILLEKSVENKKRYNKVAYVNNNRIK
jgi:hypothetical protein